MIALSSWCVLLSSTSRNTDDDCSSVRAISSALLLTREPASEISRANASA